MDVWFEKLGYAPTFRYAISAETAKLKIVLKRGRVLSGTVTRLVDGEKKPVIDTSVALRLATEDLGYRQRTITGQGGRFKFRVTPPPGDKEWMVEFASEIVGVYVTEDDPPDKVDFEIQVSARKRKPALEVGI